MPRSILRSVGKANRASYFFRPSLEILLLAHCSGIYWFLGCPSVFDILVLFATFRIVGPGFGDRLSLARSVRTLMMTHTTFARGVDSGKQLYPLQTLLRP